MVAESTAASYTATSSTCAACAAQHQNSKHSNAQRTYLFYPLAFETMDSISEVGQGFISELGHRIFSFTEDQSRETSFLFRRLYVAVRRFNAVCFNNSFSHDHTHLANRPKHI
jgi:hypothetical protein